MWLLLLTTISCCLLLLLLFTVCYRLLLPLLLLPHSRQDLVFAHSGPCTSPCPAAVGWLHLDALVAIVSH